MSDRTLLYILFMVTPRFIKISSFSTFFKGRWTLMMFSALWLVQLIVQITILAGFSIGQSHDTPPISLEMQWFRSDADGGFYVLNVSVGTPAQRQMVVLDSGYSDVLLHYPRDALYQQACEAQTPVPLCVSCKSNPVSPRVKFHRSLAHLYASR
jgi:hypothetical protein